MSSPNLQPILIGDSLRLRPLEKTDFEALYRAAADPRIWAQHPDSQRYKRDVFQEHFFASALTSQGALIIEESHSGHIIGSSRYYGWNPASAEIAIGYTFIEYRHWGTDTNAELKALMLSHIFQWAKIAWFHIGKANLRSRRAVEKLGASLSHEEEKELNGTLFTQMYYKLEAARYSTENISRRGR